MGMSFGEAVSKAPGAQLAVKPTPGAEKVCQYLQHLTPAHTCSIASFRSTKDSIHILIPWINLNEIVLKDWLSLLL